MGGVPLMVTSKWRWNGRCVGCEGACVWCVCLCVCVCDIMAPNEHTSSLMCCDTCVCLCKGELLSLC